MKPENQLIVVEQLPPLDRFLTKPEVLQHIGLSNTTLYKLIKDGNFPQQIRIKHCTNVVWSAFAVHQWMEDQKGTIDGGVL